MINITRGIEVGHTESAHGHGYSHKSEDKLVSFKLIKFKILITSLLIAKMMDGFSSNNASL